MNNIGFKITVEFDCPDMIDEQDFHEEFGCNPDAAYKSIAINDSPLSFCKDQRIVKVEVLGGKQQNEAIDFAKWINDSHWINVAHAGNQWWSVRFLKFYTTEELYEIFKNT